MTIAERIGEIHLARSLDAQTRSGGVGRAVVPVRARGRDLRGVPRCGRHVCQCPWRRGSTCLPRLARRRGRAAALGPHDDDTVTGRIAIASLHDEPRRADRRRRCHRLRSATILSSPWQYVASWTPTAPWPAREALSWAEHGIDAFGVRDTRLVEALAEEYHHAADHLTPWTWYGECSNSAADSGEYKRLERHGAERRLAVLERQSDGSSAGRRHATGGRDASELVRVHLARRRGTSLDRRASHGVTAAYGSSSPQHARATTPPTRFQFTRPSRTNRSEARTIAYRSD